LFRGDQVRVAEVKVSKVRAARVKTAPRLFQV
jgi:hypothetical protein